MYLDYDHTSLTYLWEMFNNDPSKRKWKIQIPQKFPYTYKVIGYIFKEILGLETIYY